MKNLDSCDICSVCGAQATEHYYPDNQPFSVHLCKSCNEESIRFREQLNNLHNLTNERKYTPEFIKELRDRLKKLKNV